MEFSVMGTYKMVQVKIIAIGDWGSWLVHAKMAVRFSPRKNNIPKVPHGQITVRW